MHWGGVCHREGAPRVSIAMEFVGPGSEVREVDLPLVKTDGELPGFGFRLWAISRAIEGYANFDPQVVRYQTLAGRILERLGDLQ